MHKQLLAVYAQLFSTAMPMDESLYFKHISNFYTKSPYMSIYKKKQQHKIAARCTLSQEGEKFPQLSPETLQNLPTSWAAVQVGPYLKTVLGLSRSRAAAEGVSRGRRARGGAPTGRGIRLHIPNMSSMDNERCVLCKRALLHTGCPLMSPLVRTRCRMEMPLFGH